MAEASENGALDELRAMLLGWGEYGRAGAPEFDLFADLAPAFSNDHCHFVMDNLLRMGAGIRSERQRAIRALLTHCAATWEAEAAGEVAQRSPWAIFYFPADLARAVLEAIRRSEQDDRLYRLELAIALTLRLPADQAVQMLLEEIQGTDALADDIRGSALVSLVAALANRLFDQSKDELLYQELEQVEERIHRIPDAYLRIQALFLLAMIFPEGERDRRVEEAWDETSVLEEGPQRAELRAVIASYLEGGKRHEALAQAIQEAQALDALNEMRLYLLTLLSLSLDESPVDTDEQARGEVIASGLAPYESGQIQWPSAQVALARTLARLAENLPAAFEERFRRWVQVCELRADDPGLLPLTFYAAPEQIHRILDGFGEIAHTPELMLEWLSWMTAILDEQQVAHALHALGEYASPVYQLAGFASLLPRVSEASAGEAIEFCRRLGQNWYGWRAWAALAEQIPIVDGIAPEAARGVSAENLRRLWLERSYEEQSWLVEEMVRQAWRYYGGAMSEPPSAARPLRRMKMEAPTEPEGELPTAAAPPMPEEPAAKLSDTWVEVAPPVVSATPVTGRGEGEIAEGAPPEDTGAAEELAEAEPPDWLAETEPPERQAEAELPEWLAEPEPPELLAEAEPPEWLAAAPAPAEAEMEGEPESFGAAPAEAGETPPAMMIPVTGGGEEEVGAAPEEAAAEEEITERSGAPQPAAPAPAPAVQPEPAPPPAGAFPSLLRRITSGERRRAAYDYAGGGAPGRPVVSTGFAPQQRPDQAITDRAPLRAGGEYYLVFGIGERRKFDIAPPDRPIAAPLEKLPPKARLQVALFAFPGEIEIITGKDVGELELLPNRTVIVAQPVATPQDLSDPDLLKQVLFFPVRIPARPGSYRLRVNLYCQGVLVQSYLVQAEALPLMGRVLYRLRGRRARPALETSLDYTLSNNLNTAILTELLPHSLSLMINDNGNGTHGFRFFGATGQELLKGDASFSGQELQNLIEQGRGALRQAAWGEKGEWNPQWKVEERYKYFRVKDGDWKGRLRADLVVLAKWGWRFYTHTLRQLAEQGAKTQEEAEERRQQVEQAMLGTRWIQIAARESLRHVLPAALIYDYPIIDTLPGSMFSLCQTFEAALDAGTPLADTPCFQGTCPSRGNLRAICPSGFWGFRHVLGLPVSIGGDQGNVELKITYEDSPTLAVSFSTDFALRAAHLQKIQQLRSPLGWFEADTGEETLEYLRTANAHLVYFYCHGGLTEDKVPYLQVGPENDAWGLITPSVLPAMQIRWRKPRPLVFINGCHTTALEPEAALDMVSGFVRDAGAAGVIGTEITIFEPLATAFAEDCLRQFLNGVPIGEAVRNARLALLQEGNPLGLVYIPFAVASLVLEPEAMG